MVCQPGLRCPMRSEHPISLRRSSIRRRFTKSRSGVSVPPFTFPVRFTTAPSRGLTSPSYFLRERKIKPSQQSGRFQNPLHASLCSSRTTAHLARKEGTVWNFAASSKELGKRRSRMSACLLNDRHQTPASDNGNKVLPAVVLPRPQIPASTILSDPHTLAPLRDRLM